MSNVVPLGITHDPGCSCRRCLNEAYRSADTRAVEAARRYKSIRTTGARATEISRARQQWAEARQVLVLAEYALRAAEDEAYIEERENRRTDALRWNPKEAL
jgi:hypothetical protein